MLTPNHRQRGAGEGKELHLQRAFQGLRVVLGVIPEAILFQPLQQPKDMGRGSQLSHKVEETEARRRLSAQCRASWFPLQSSHSFH